MEYYSHKCPHNSDDLQVLIKCHRVKGLPWWLRKQRIYLQCRRPGFGPRVGKICWRREWQPASVFLPEESHGLRSLVAYSPWHCIELDMTEQLTLSLQDCLIKITLLLELLYPFSLVFSFHNIYLSLLYCVIKLV